MHFNLVNGSDFYCSLWRFLNDLTKDYIGTMTNVQASHGELVHWRCFGGLFNFAFVADPTVNRELFVRNNDALGKPLSQIQTFLYAAGNSVATAHGNEWRTKRREANNLFTRNIVEASCAGQVDVIRNFVKTHTAQSQDAILLARRMAALTSSRSILGRVISVVEADVQIAFSKAASDRFNAESVHLFARPNWILAPWRKDLNRQKKKVFPLVQEAIDDLRSSDAPNDGLMNYYVNGDFITSSDEEMLTILVGLLMGAQDNVAAATAWLFAFLAHHPALQTKIRNEIGNINGEAQELNKCVVLKATILEVLRLRPPAPANQPRVLLKAVEIANHTLPKGTYLFNSFFNMHHNVNTFVEPEKFDPTIFLDGELEQSPSFVPFGHGPRNCVAQKLAMQQLVAIVTGTLQHHQVKTRHDTLLSLIHI